MVCILPCPTVRAQAICAGDPFAQPLLHLPARRRQPIPAILIAAALLLLFSARTLRGSRK
jgi:hypothetical protein